MQRYPATVFAVLVAVFFLVIHQETAVGEELSEYLWSQTETYHQQALASPYIQGLKTASLDPIEFGAYNVQDAIYLYQGKASMDIAVSRTEDEGLKQFLQDRAKGYQEEYESAFIKWHIGDPEGISVGPACDNYNNHLNNVARTMDPIYLVAALTPCSKLWPWLGQQIDSDSEKFGVYNAWVSVNLNKTYTGYMKYDKMIDDAFKDGTIQKEAALQVYGESMKAEVAFFSSVSDENQNREHDEL